MWQTVQLLKFNIFKLFKFAFNSTPYQTFLTSVLSLSDQSLTREHVHNSSCQIEEKLGEKIYSEPYFGSMYDFILK